MISQPHAGRVQRARVPLVTAVLVGALALAGCTSSDTAQIATAGGAAAAASASPEPSSTADYEEQRLAFAQCMRDNGVPMPDPGSGSGPGQGFRSLEGVDQDTLDEAMTACESLRPSFGGGTAQDLSEADKQTLLDMAQCLRDEGFDVPDPTFDGRGGFLRPGPDSSINPRDPEFRSAMETCSAEVGWEGRGGRGPGGSESVTPSSSPA